MQYIILDSYTTALISEYDFNSKYTLLLIRFNGFEITFQIVYILFAHLFFTVKDGSNRSCILMINRP